MDRFKEIGASVGCTVMYMLIIGETKTFGILYTEMLVYYNAGAAKTGWIGCLAIFLMCSLSPLSISLCRRYSYRKVAFLEGFLIAIGHVISSFISSVDLLFWSFGIVTGIGFGLTFSPSTTLISFFVNKHRHLINKYGMRGTFLLIGGIQLHICVASCFLAQPEVTNEEEMANNEVIEGFVAQRNTKYSDVFKELEDGLDADTNSKGDNDAESEMKDNTSAYDMGEDIFTGRATRSNDNVNNRDDCLAPKRIEEDRQVADGIGVDVVNVHHKALSILLTLMSEIKMYATFFKHLRFVLYMIGIASLALADMMNGILITARLQSLGYTKMEQSVCITIMSGCDIGARLFLGWFCDLKLVPTKYVFAFNSCVCSVFCFINPFFSSLMFKRIYLAALGVILVSKPALIPPLIIEGFGLDNYPKVISVIYFFAAAGNLVALPLAGSYLFSLKPPSQRIVRHFVVAGP